MHQVSVKLDRRRAQRNKKILIVNCYFPEMREPIKRVNEVPNALAPVLLAGHFCSSACDVRLYNEVNSGFLEVFSPELLGWPDMIVRINKLQAVTFKHDNGATEPGCT